MKNALKALGALLLALILVVFIVGSLLPREHVARSTLVLPVPADTAWAAIRDFERVAGWWDDLTAVRRVDDPEGREIWQHTMRGDAIAIAVERSDAPEILVTRVMAGPDAPYGGIWTYQLETVPSGTRITITEAGYINSRLFRFVAATFMGLHHTMDSYLTDLAAHLGADAMPEHVE